LENLINSRVREIEISGIRKFYNLAAKYDNVLSLTIGQPDFPTPMHIKEAGKSAIDTDQTVYTPNAGIEPLRKAACDYINTKYNMRYHYEDEIIITNGASEAIDITLRTILTEDCEVILPAPVYPGYEPLIKLMGAMPVYVDTTESDFILTAALIEAKLSEKTRCVILPSPSNPTGAVIPIEELEKISKLLQNRALFVLSDEIYSELVYDQAHHSIAACEGMREKTIVINGLSKSHAMTGWRIGFTLAPAYLTKNMLKVHQYNSTCAPSISQVAATEALTFGIDDALAMKAAYLQRRDYIYHRLMEMKLDVVKPRGAFYIFPSIEQFGLDSFAFATKLLEQQRVAVVPGSAFSDYGDHFIRISFACSLDTLKTGLDRLETFVTSLK
jgi:aminotransferase